MAKKVGRNQACPCGSGKKYKNCHLGLTTDPTRQGDGQTLHSEIPLTAQRGWARAIPWVMGLAGGSVSVATFLTVNTQAGLSVLAATTLVIGGWFIFGNPPPPKDDAGDPAGLNFGR
jgi:hypothetical protein